MFEYAERRQACIVSTRGIPGKKMSGGINKSAGMQNLREGRLNWCLGEGCCRESENNGGSFLYPSPRPSLSTSNLAA